MNIAAYQRELRHSYVRGGPGTVISGMIWLLASLVSLKFGILHGFLCLFFAGMLIFPLANLACRILFKRCAESKENPGGLVVIETIFPMLGGFFIAWLLLPTHPAWVFPICAIAVGAHYFGFRSAYGDWSYWVIGGLLCLVGVVAILIPISSVDWVGFTVAIIEILFGLIFTFRGLREDGAQ